MDLPQLLPLSLQPRPRRRRPCLAFLCLLLLLTSSAHAHIGAPDVYLKTAAGPYPLLVGIHPPLTTPGAAAIDIRTEDADITAISVSLSGQPPQTLQRFASEQIFTGSVWVNDPGAQHITLHVTGPRGEAETSIPIPAGPTTWPNHTLLIGTAAILCLLVAAILLRRRRLIFLLAVLPASSAILIAATFVAGRPAATPTLQLTLSPGGQLQIILPGNTPDLIDDHNHPMHLFAIRQPRMDVLLHLHPVQTAPRRFQTDLPAMAPGEFLLFADILHRDGRLETLTAQAGLPIQTGHPLQGDDSLGIVPGLDRAQPAQAPGSTSAHLMDGYSLTLHLDQPLHPRTGQLLRFSLRDPSGDPPPDMQLYMGMAAHAAVLKTDGTVFAHIHPAGTLPMAGMDMSATPASDVSFPFGFPTAGPYRIFVQMKHGVTVETAAFDLQVR